MTDEPSNLLTSIGLNADEIIALRSKAAEENLCAKAVFSRTNTLKKNINLSKYISSKLWECNQVLSTVGVYSKIYITQENYGIDVIDDWEKLLEILYSDPAVFKNKVLWLLFQALLEAQRDFALDICPPRSHETYLTGEFVGAIRCACNNFAKSAQEYLSRSGSEINISRIDLSVGGYEQDTGGDLAIIIEIDEVDISPCDLEEDILTLTGQPRGSIIIPLVFQVKRFVGTRAKISQHHEERGYQFNILRQTTCASNYLFYENGTNRVERPSLPMVKAPSKCMPVEDNPYTEVFENSIDFATYILRAVNGFPDIPAAESREDALNMILANASEDRIGHVVVLANNEGCELLYKNALNKLRNEIDAKPSEPSGPSGPKM